MLPLRRNFIFFILACKTNYFKVNLQQLSEY